MSAFLKSVSAALLILGVCIFSSCRPKAELDSNGYPRTLIMAMYAGESPGATKASMEEIRKYLEKKVGLPVEIQFSTDYTSVIEAIRSKKVHFADLSPFSYILATQRGGLTPIASLGRDGKPAVYSSVIFASKKSGIKSIEDLKVRSKSLTLCFSDPASTSGHLIPTAYLNSIGLNPETAFKETVFAGSHSAAILSVASGKTDIGCSIKLFMDMMASKKQFNEDDVRIIWTSPPITSDAITVRNELNKDLVAKLKSAFLNMKRDAPELIINRLKIYIKDVQNIGYVPTSDTNYNGLRRIAAGVKDLNVFTK